MKGPIGYELSPMAEEFSQLVIEAFHPGDLRANRLLQIIELMDVEIDSRGKSIQTMNTILGYDNSDGMHSTPTPEDLAKRAIEARDLLKKLVHDSYDLTTVDIFSKALQEARAQFEGVKSNELTGPSAENPPKEGQEPLPAPVDSKADPAEGTEK